MTISRVSGSFVRAQSGPQNSLSVTLPLTPQSGNSLVACIGTRDYSADRTVSSITQTGVSWSRQIQGSGALQVSEIWLGTVGANASTSITINFSGSASANACNLADVCEYTETLVSDVSQANNGSGSTLSTGTTSTTTSSNELWIGTGCTGATSHTSPTNGFTQLDGNAIYGTISYLEKIVSSTGNATCSVTLGVGTLWVGAIATFKTSGGTPTFTITASADAHSSISPSGQVNVNQGANQSFNMSAASGYHITHVYVDSVDQGALSSYTFYNVTSNHTILVYSAIDAADLIGNNLTVYQDATIGDALSIGGNVQLSLAKSLTFTGSTGRVDGTNIGAIAFKDTYSIDNNTIRILGEYDSEGPPLHPYTYKLIFDYYRLNEGWKTLATLTEHGKFSVLGTIESQELLVSNGIESKEYWQHFGKFDFNDTVYYHQFLNTTGYVKFYDLNEYGGGHNYLLLHGELLDGDPILVCSQHIAIEKDLIAKGMLNSLEGEVALNAGRYSPGWGPETRNPFIQLADRENPNDPNYIPTHYTLEIRRIVANGSGEWAYNHIYGEIWGWGDLECGQLNTHGLIKPGVWGQGSSIPLYKSADNAIAYNQSTLRVKQNVNDLTDCSWIYNLRPVIFDWKDQKRAKAEGRQLGLIAEEVNAICPQLTWLDSEGKPEGVHYEWLGVPLIVELKKLKTEVDDLRNQIKQLTAVRGD
jgi:hypothetical protein